MVLTVVISSTDGVPVSFVWSPLLARKIATAEAGWQDQGRETELTALGRSNEDTAELCRAHICRMSYRDGWTKYRVGPEREPKRSRSLAKEVEMEGCPAAARVFEVEVTVTVQETHSLPAVAPRRSKRAQLELLLWEGSSCLLHRFVLAIVAAQPR